MKTFAETYFECSPEEAWLAVVDFQGRGNFSSRIRDAAIVEGGDFMVGKHLRLRIDKRDFTLLVAEVNAPSYLRLGMSGPLFKGSHRYKVEARPNKTMVRIDANYGSLLGTVFGFFMKGRVQKDLSEELLTIRRQSEDLKERRRLGSLEGDSQRLLIRRPVANANAQQSPH